MSKTKLINQARAQFKGKSSEFIADAYGRSIYSEIWNFISTGFTCRNVKEFYKECSLDEADEIQSWHMAVYGYEICKAVDDAIDRALTELETEIGNVEQVTIQEHTCFKAGTFVKSYSAYMILINRDHKRDAALRRLSQLGPY